MNTKLVSIVSILSCNFYLLAASAFHQQNPMLFGLTVQFPHTLTATPEIRAYSSGHILKGSLDNKTKKIFFGIPANRYDTTFALLIVNTDSIGCVTDSNTVKYLTIDPNKPYKLYIVTLKERVISPSNSTKEPRTEFYWTIDQALVDPQEGRLPDTTIILCYNPDFIEKLEGGNSVDLPTIYIKNNIISLLGSESKLHEKSAEFLLGSLDYDALHATIKEHVKPCYASKTVLTLTA